MIRTFVQTGDLTQNLTRYQGEPEGPTTAELAEAAYWRAVVTRTEGPAAFVVAPGPGLDLIVDSGRYRLDRTWHGVREQDTRRWLRYWARPLERGGEDWPGIEAHHVRGLLAAAGWSQLHAAQVVGVDARTMRKWCAGEGMTYPAWVLLRDLALEAIAERNARGAP